MKRPEKSSERSRCRTIWSGRIQTGGIRAQRHVLDVIKNSKIIADEINHRQMMYLGNVYIPYSLSIHGFCALATNVGLFCGI